MKKWILLIALIPVLLNGQAIRSDFEISDSLKGGTDTLNIHYMGFGGGGYEMGKWWIAAKDTGATYKDSAAVFAGHIRYHIRTGSAIDTFWTRIWLKDSVGNNTNVIQASATQSYWIPLLTMPVLLKFELINAEFVNSRRWDYTVQGKKIK